MRRGLVKIHPQQTDTELLNPNQKRSRVINTYYLQDAWETWVYARDEETRVPAVKIDYGNGSPGITIAPMTINEFWNWLELHLKDY